MSTALFINGIYNGVLAEILEAQVARGGGESFIQPYKGHIIGMLKKHAPTPEDPIRLYVSTTDNLGQICYAAEIVRWEDKRELSEERKREVGKLLDNYQPGEAQYFKDFDKTTNKEVNLVTIRSLKQLETLHSTSLLQKVSDGMSLKEKIKGWRMSEVHDIGDLFDLPVETKEQHDSNLSSGITSATTLLDEVIQKKLDSAEKLPQKVQVVSVGYRRNPNVIVAVLRRANGVCEKCKRKAPFIRRSDGSPYLEIHHWKPLAEGGEDTVNNAGALCPNCHRELHHGQIPGEKVL